MKLLRFLSVFLGLVTLPLSAVDVELMKKMVGEGVSSVSKSAIDDAKKASDDFKLRDSQAAIIVKTYSKEDHEEFRTAEEGRLVDRVSSGAQKMAADVDAMLEKAFIDILKRENEFDAAAKKDIGVFKQQFGESIAKMLQGKKPTPITYSSAEAVAKPAEEAPGKKGMPAASIDTAAALPLLPAADKAGKKDVVAQGVLSDVPAVDTKKGSPDSKKSDDKKSLKDKKDADVSPDQTDDDAPKPFAQAKAASALPVLPPLGAPVKPAAGKKTK